ncbi:protein of unknown function [Acidithiobacillus ferrivorans]|uniref:Uncharacterized protein n=1 Tax=Acidithiobacillus ferrivorans TaxID=160808 RepID=A0ABY1MPZ9_9PROT|nr:protein of unknown function [Acidithiobacillus ferrivorans]
MFDAGHRGTYVIKNRLSHATSCQESLNFLLCSIDLLVGQIYRGMSAASSSITGRPGSVRMACQ